MTIIKKASNATTLQLRVAEVTFWHRAAAAVGRIEAWRSNHGLYVAMTLFGFMVSVASPYLALAGEKHRTLVSWDLDWAQYNCNRSFSLSRWFGDKFANMLAKFVGWALSKRVVQEAIVHEFTSRSTPMCCALQRAVSSEVTDQLNGLTIEAENVEGLERCISDNVESAMSEIDLSSFKDFDEAVERVVNGMDTDDIVENVVEDLCNRLRSR